MSSGIEPCANTKLSTGYEKEPNIVVLYRDPSFTNIHTHTHTHTHTYST